LRIAPPGAEEAEEVVHLEKSNNSSYKRITTNDIHPLYRERDVNRINYTYCNY